MLLSCVKTDSDSDKSSSYADYVVAGCDAGHAEDVAEMCCGNKRCG